MSAQPDVVPAPPAGREESTRLVRLLLVFAGTPLLRWAVTRLSVDAGAPARRTCERCGARLSLTGTGWAAMLPAGRCGRCGRRVGAPPYVLELLAAVAAVVVVLAAPTVPVLLSGLWWAGCAVALILIDLRVHRLPDALTWPAAAGTVALLAIDAAVGARWTSLVSSLVSAAVAGGMFLLVALVLGHRGMGLGDAKLIVSLAALLGWWGWGTAFGGVFLGFLFAGVVSAALLATGRVGRGAHIPMGPFFVGGALVMLALLAVAG